MQLTEIRREYQGTGLSRKSLAPSPFTQFENWLAEVQNAGLGDITAMILATVSAQGEPLQRTVLLKEVTEEGFVFYTSLDSAKACHIVANAKVCLLFPWYLLDRQVIISGKAEQVDQDQARQYFESRPRESQLAACASRQSAPVANRQALLDQYAAAESLYSGKQAEMPVSWGGYRVKPMRFEFWQGRENRLHDRFEYILQDEGGWETTRLSP